MEDEVTDQLSGGDLRVLDPIDRNGWKASKQNECILCSGCGRQVMAPSAIPVGPTLVSGFEPVGG